MILELRQYTLQPGRRDELIELFEREFVESQEAVGARVLGTFREPERPDRFVWVRGFVDMATRLSALQRFYGGPVWQQHRAAANATMVDSDDVLLLEPVRRALIGTPRPPVGEGAPGPGRVLAVVHLLDTAPAPDAPAVEHLLGVPLVVARTAAEANDFPALPVRDERAEVWFAVFPDADALHAAVQRAAGTAAWGAPAQVMALEPTARSEVR